MPPEHPTPWTLVHDRSLTDLLNVEDRVTNGGCRWRRGQCPASATDDIEAAAWLVASEIMKLRCGKAEAIYAAWRRTATGEDAGDDTSVVAPFIDPTFGLPPNGRSLQHAQGYVAEITWRMLAEEHESEERRLEFLTYPDADVTSPGADGFAVYRLQSSGQLVFRLWEIKKKDGAGSVSSSIRNAYHQLDENAERYLAKLTSQSGNPGMDGELVNLFVSLVPAWKRSETIAGAGVAVAADADGLPGRAFTTMHKHFPDFVVDSRIEGCLVGLGSLSDFSLRVRGLLWTGLSTDPT